MKHAHSPWSLMLLYYLPWRCPKLGVGLQRIVRDARARLCNCALLLLYVTHCRVGPLRPIRTTVCFWRSVAQSQSVRSSFLSETGRNVVFQAQFLCGACASSSSGLHEAISKMPVSLSFVFFSHSTPSHGLGPTRIAIYFRVYVLNRDDDEGMHHFHLGRKGPDDPLPQPHLSKVGG